MAGVNQINLKYVNNKLEFLETLQSYINAAVADYINEVVSAGKAWVASSGDQATFLNISHRIENAIHFLGFKCQEISEQHRTETSGENTPQERQHLLKKVTVPQPAPTLVAASQHGQTTESVQVSRCNSLQSCDEEKCSSEKDFLPHQVLAKFGVIEEAIYSLHSNMEKVTKQQTETDNRFENVTAKLLELNKQMSDVSMADKQQKKRLKEHTEKITDIQAEIQKQYESRIQSLEKMVKKLSAKQDKLEEEGCSRDDMNEELEEKVKDVSEDNETIKCKISALEDNLTETASSVKDVLNRVVSQEQVIQSLCTKVDSSQDRNVMILKEFEDKLQVTETRMKEDLEKVGEQFEETETSFRNVCQLIANRLKPLEELRSILNQRARTQDDNVRQLQEMVKEVAAISPKLTQLESQFTTSAFGFTAWAFVTDSDVVDSVITSYYNYSYSNGNHFDLDTGIFTAPVAGTYVAFIKIKIVENNGDKDDEDEENELIIQVRHENIEFTYSDIVCCCKIESHIMSVDASDLGVIHMKAGDTLYAEVEDKTLCGDVGSFTFSCFMIR